MGTANALRKGLRVWMLLPRGRKQYLVTGESCDGLDSLVGDRTSIDRIPVLFEPVAPTEPWSRDMLDLLQYQEDWLEDTPCLMPVWEEGRLLGVIGGAPAEPISDGLHDLIRYVAAAIRKLDQWETGCRDLATVRTLLSQPEKSIVVTTSRGRVIGATPGAFAILSRLHNRAHSHSKAEDTIPQVLRAMIAKGDRSVVIDDLKVFLSLSACPEPTTVDPACSFTFERHLKEATATARSTAQAYESLSPAERRVIPLALQGKQNKEIAQALFLSCHTVKRHMRHILAKYGCQDRVTLILRVQGASTPTVAPMVAVKPMPDLRMVNIKR
jgi:DNA-binding CsgD family transcriptional regulator